MVWKFHDVFLEDLPGLPSDCEIKFSIDLLLDTQPISITPYGMGKTDLEEL